jgi:hypothetical protein
VNENLPENLATLQFPWTEEYDAICISDVGSFFNHSSEPTAEVKERDFVNLIQTFAAKTDISKIFAVRRESCGMSRTSIGKDPSLSKKTTQRV